MTASRIEKCSCKHEFQDEKYGKNNRVWNPCLKKDNFRCTVCEKTQFFSSVTNEKVSKK